MGCLVDDLEGVGDTNKWQYLHLNLAADILLVELPHLYMLRVDLIGCRRVVIDLRIRRYVQRLGR